MLLLSFLGGFFVGAIIQHIWGNHRSKYYRNKMDHIVFSLNMAKHNNKILKRSLEEMRKRLPKTDPIGIDVAIAELYHESNR